MEEIDGNVCVQNDADSSLQNIIKKNSKFIVKKVRLTRIASKRRRNEKSKKGILDKKNISEKSVFNFVPQNTTSGTINVPVINLLEKHSFKYEVMQDSDKHNFFLQDKYMNTFFKCYPEYLCIDFLCEIPDLELNLCLFNCIDGNGCSDIVSVGLIKTLDSGLSWLCEVFKKYNPNWSKVRLIICDSKARSYEVIKKAFPEKWVLISFYHSMNALKKDLHDVGSEITEQDMNKILNIFEQMVFANDESSYTENFKQMKQMPAPIVTYFRKVWHQKKSYWTWGHQLNSKIFLKSFHNVLSCTRKEIRPLVNILNTVVKVIEKLCSFLKTSRKDKFEKFTSIFEMTSLCWEQILQRKYSKFVTCYALELIFEQFSMLSHVKNIEKLSCGKYVCSSEGIVTTTACSCNFFQLLSLPCSHILALRKHLYLPLFCEDLCLNRWIITNYQNTFLDLQNTYILEYKDEEYGNAESERYCKYFKLCAELWPLIVNCSEPVSQERLQVLKNLFEAWKSYFKVSIKMSENEKKFNSSITLNDASIDCWKEMYGISIQDTFD
ncbi:MULE domain-containing protein [Nephila pilipes]|uniref:MULE domain-containing protein n=1 Tax=Nephila pilipes TaxID=299642 RepID=A0A8X6MAL3_NEPPI|nr:MULE domain-containing protein [Nephila pilipes]